jgi:hypothetical protein
MIRSNKTKKAFIKYLEKNPDLRFWQAVRNFSKYNFILGSNVPVREIDDENVSGIEDTFYKEEL